VSTTIGKPHARNVEEQAYASTADGETCVRSVVGLRFASMDGPEVGARNVEEQAYASTADGETCVRNAVEGISANTGVRKIIVRNVVERISVNTDG
jgi:hypothetical protein